MIIVKVIKEIRTTVTATTTIILIIILKNV